MVLNGVLAKEILREFPSIEHSYCQLFSDTVSALKLGRGVLKATKYAKAGAMVVGGTVVVLSGASAVVGAGAAAAAFASYLPATTLGVLATGLMENGARRLELNGQAATVRQTVASRTDSAELQRRLDTELDSINKDLREMIKTQLINFGTSAALATGVRAYQLGKLSGWQLHKLMLILRE